MTEQTERGDDRRRTGDKSHTSTFDTTTQRVSEELLLTIAALENTDPLEMPLLSDSVDPDALDTFVSTAANRYTDGRVEFEYEGYHVRVTTDGTIALESSP